MATEELKVKISSGIREFSFLVLSDTHSLKTTIKGIVCPSDEEVLGYANKNNEGFHTVKRINPTDNICPYCKSDITGYSDPDILCSECRDTFGHFSIREL